MDGVALLVLLVSRIRQTRVSLQLLIIEPHSRSLSLFTVTHSSKAGDGQTVSLGKLYSLESLRICLLQVTCGEGARVEDRLSEDIPEKGYIVSHTSNHIVIKGIYRCSNRILS